MRKITMLGSGFIGRFYASTLHAKRGRDQVHVFYSRTAERAREAAEMFGAPKWTDNMREAIEDPETDVVVIGLPNYQHKEAVIMAAEAGKAVLCTKPLARNAAEAKEMLDAVEKAGVFAGYLEDLVYTPQTLKALEFVRDGALGKVLWVRSRETHPGPHSDWFLNKELAGGGAIHRLVLQRLAGVPMIMSLLATYAISTILVNVAILVWGGGYRGLPGVLDGSVQFLGVSVSFSRLVAFLVALGVSLAVWWMLGHTRFGRAVRSVSQAPELAEISGISIERVRNATFALGAAMAGLAGVLLAPTIASDPQLGSRFLVKAFAVIIVGGMGSYPGTIAAALLLGVVEVGGGYATGPVIGSALLYLLMLLVLLLRPRGLLGVGMRT